MGRFITLSSVYFSWKSTHTSCDVLKNHAAMHRRHLAYSFIHFVCLKQERNRGGGGQSDGDRSGRAGALGGRRSGGRRSAGAPRRLRRAGGGSSTSRARSTPRGCGEHGCAIGVHWTAVVVGCALARARGGYRVSACSTTWSACTYGRSTGRR